MTGDLKRTTDAMAEQLKQQVKDAKAALAERVKVEREAAKQLEDAKKAQLDTEKRYSEALAKLGSAGAGDPSYGQAQALKVGARAALAGGDVEGAKKQAQAALDVLTQLAAAGENTYGFEGFIRELQAIEQSADQINVDKAQASFNKAAENAAKLKAVLDEASSVKVSVDLPPEEIERIKGVMQALAAEISQSMVITPKVALPKAGEADADGYVFVPDLPPAPRFAAGGHVRGPGSGTSDSIPALLSNGEYVINAAAVRKLGKGYLDLINNGIPLRRFADGGMVESVAGMTAPGADNRVPANLYINGDKEPVSVMVNQDSFDRLLRRTALKSGRT